LTPEPMVKMVPGLSAVTVFTVLAPFMAGAARVALANAPGLTPWPVTSMVSPAWATARASCRVLKCGRVTGPPEAYHVGV